MSDRYFIDTNVLVYANDRSSPERRARAREILAHAISTRQGCLSTQVLQEFFVVVTKKAGVSAANARAQVVALSRLDIVMPDATIVLSAIDLHIIHHLSFWDALILKSAAAAGCRRLLTDDLGHGQVIDGVRIENPFG